ncbi:hypothetical protein MKZ02_23900 [Pseudobacillus sp. FSL P4-0506]|uniref:hypothetical protein n=1 Tax=unclassified Pseudobacillus TaxID=2619284 RepID=UPI0030F94A68
MRFVEESIILVSVAWMVIYLYGLYELSSAAYSHWLILIPVLLTLVLIFSFFRKIRK